MVESKIPKNPSSDKEVAAPTTVAAVSETNEEGLIFRKLAIGGRAKITLCCMRYRGCTKMDLKLDDSTWQFKCKKDRILIRKEEKGETILITARPGIFYWETELGYIAVFWKADKLKILEIGNYMEGYVEFIECGENEFDGPYKLKKQGSRVHPFSRFLLDIKPAGSCLMT